MKIEKVPEIHQPPDLGGKLKLKQQIMPGTNHQIKTNRDSYPDLRKDRIQMHQSRSIKKMCINLQIKTRDSL